MRGKKGLLHLTIFGPLSNFESTALNKTLSPGTPEGRESPLDEDGEVWFTTRSSKREKSISPGSSPYDKTQKMNFSNEHTPVPISISNSFNLLNSIECDN